MNFKTLLSVVACITAALLSGTQAKPTSGSHHDLSPVSLVSQAETTPAPVVECSYPSLENNDGLCTCWTSGVAFTTFTPDGGPGNDCHSSTVVPGAPAATSTPTPRPGDNVLHWMVLGDSWSSGVAYSLSTVYSIWTDFENCFRTTQAYGAMMANSAPALAGGDWAWRPQLAVGTFGGNDAFFGDIARACIFKPAPGPWGVDYDNDPDGTGWCKKYMAQAREFIDAPNGLAAQFRVTIDTLYNYSQQEDQQRPRFDLYVSGYVEFFNTETDPCDHWTFARWFSTGSPKLVKALRSEINELVRKFNDVQNTVVVNYKPPVQTSNIFNVRYVPISHLFEGHRFCDWYLGFADQWYSKDLWLWNLSWKNGNPEMKSRRRQGGDTEQDEDASMSLTKIEGDVVSMGKPPGAEDGPFDILPLDEHDPPDLSNMSMAVGTTGSGGPVNVKPVNSQFGFGWTSRPFHPKPLGAKAMKDAYIAAFRADGVPGVY